MPQYHSTNNRHPCRLLTSLSLVVLRASTTFWCWQSCFDQTDATGSQMPPNYDPFWKSYSPTTEPSLADSDRPPQRAIEYHLLPACPYLSFCNLACRYLTPRILYLQCSVLHGKLDRCEWTSTNTHNHTPTRKDRSVFVANDSFATQGLNSLWGHCIVFKHCIILYSVEECAYTWPAQWVASPARKQAEQPCCWSHQCRNLVQPA